MARRMLALALAAAGAAAYIAARRGPGRRDVSGNGGSPVRAARARRELEQVREGLRADGEGAGQR